MDMLASLLPFAMVLSALTLGLIAVQRHRGGRQEVRFVRVNAGRRRRG